MTAQDRLRDRWAQIHTAYIAGLPISAITPVDPDIADYRGFHVWHQVHPVWPSMDWHWAPIDHDPECPSDRCGTGPTQESCCDQIKELLAEEAFERMRSDNEDMGYDD